MHNHRCTPWGPVLLGAVLTVAVINPPPDPAYSQGSRAPAASIVLVGDASAAPLAELACDDPLALLRYARVRCAARIQDYRCVLVRQERLDGDLGAVQEIEMRYRAEPHSVYLHWRENAQRALRATYVAGRSQDRHGRELAEVEPAGCVARLIAPRVKIQVDGDTARRSSRCTMDQAGYRGTFGSIRRVNAAAAANGDLQLEYLGNGEVDGRPTYVLRRQLPYPHPEHKYPNGCLVLHLDQEWLLPVGVYMYADAHGGGLLGSYTMTQVEVNTGLEDSAFEL